jgi:hypothetical protein
MGSRSWASTSGLAVPLRVTATSIVCPATRPRSLRLRLRPIELSSLGGCTHTQLYHMCIPRALILRPRTLETLNPEGTTSRARACMHDQISQTLSSETWTQNLERSWPHRITCSQANIRATCVWHFCARVCSQLNLSLTLVRRAQCPRNPEQVAGRGVGPPWGRQNLLHSI